MQLLREHDEHDPRPGARYENYLMFDAGFSCILNEMELHEGTDAQTGKKAVLFRGKVQEANAINKNRRKYTRDILEQNVNRLNEVIHAGALIGECDHPADSIIHFEKSSHKITRLWWEGDIVMCEGALLHSPMGMLLANLIDDKVRIGMSSRGVGSGKVDQDGVLVIGESYKLITFDAVADPSTDSAWQERVVRHQREAYEPRRVFSAPRRAKNEHSRIHTSSNSNLVLACLGGIFSQQTAKAKERINA